MPDYGTPTDLKDAIVRGLQEIVPDMEVTRDNQFVKRFHDIIQDRLSQNFSTAMCEGSTAQADAMRRLWHSIFPRKAGH